MLTSRSFLTFLIALFCLLFQPLSTQQAQANPGQLILQLGHRVGPPLAKFGGRVLQGVKDTAKAFADDIAIAAIENAPVAWEKLQEWWNGKPSPAVVKDIQKSIDEIANQNKPQAESLEALSYRIQQAVTREQLQRELCEAAKKFDASLAAQADALLALTKEQKELSIRLKQMERTQADTLKRVGITEAQLFQTREDVARLSSQVSGLGIRLTAVEQELAELKAYSPADVADRLAMNGMDLLNQGESKDAIKLFVAAYGYNPEDPTPHYGIGFAQFRLGETTQARMSLARGAALERNKQLPEWFLIKLERVQGWERKAFSASRTDPISGLRSPGGIPTDLYLPLPGELPSKQSR